jgi:malonate-semialdehyde dehydrogenase (acetylating)/methylmalonate-semialdehyde dehydrogenase
MREAGLPEGVLQVVHGDREMVDAILDHPAIGAVSFVGSSDIAHYVYSRGVAAGKRVQAMGGAKNHGVVMPDADLDQTVDDLVRGRRSVRRASAAWRCRWWCRSASGPPRRCASGWSRRSRRCASAYRPIRGALRPVVNAAHKAKVESWIQAGIDEGAELVVDGRGFALAGARAGLLPRPEPVRPGSRRR